MEDIIDIIVTETTNLIEITSQPTDEIIDVNIIDNREDVTLNVTPTVVEININSLTGNFGVNWGDIAGTLSDQTDLQNVLDLKADLVDGKVPSSQLPSYVDDVIEVATYSALPTTGEVGKIYVVLDTNLIYRWSGSAYIEIKDSSAVWGAITGTLSNQTDLQNALNDKMPTITFNSPLFIGSGGDVTIPLATTSANGYLSSTDWNTFNNKVGGSGTNTYLAMFSASKTLTSSAISYDGTKTTVEAQGLVSLNGLELQGAYNSVSGLKLLSNDSTIGYSYMEFSNTGGGFRLGVNRNTAGGILSGSATYATFLTTTGATSLQLGANGALILSLNTSGLARFYNQVQIDNTVTATQFIRTGGTSSQFLKADGSVDTNTYLTTSSASSTYVSGSGTTNYISKFTAASVLGNSNIQDSGTLITLGSDTAINGLISGTITKVLPTGNTFAGQTFNITGSANGWNVVSRNTWNINDDAFTTVGFVVTDNRAIINRSSTAANGWGAYSGNVTNNGSVVQGGIVYSGITVGSGNFNSAIIYRAGGSGPFSNTNTYTNYYAFTAEFSPLNITNFYGVNISDVTASTITRALNLRISLGTGKYNIYAGGTANNYLAGNLLIGSTADNGSKLQVTGAATFSSSVTAGTQFIGNNSITDPTAGITTATVYALNGASSNNTFGLGIGAARNGSYDMWFQTGAINGGGYRWYIGTSEKMTMTNSGNVGIGTSSPTVAVGMGLVINGGATSPRIALKNNASGDASTDGFQLVLTTENEAVLENRENASMRFLTNATEAMRITSGGDVCIASTAPISTRRELRIGGNAVGSRISLGLNGTNYSALVTDSGGNVYLANEFNDSAIKLLMINYNNGVYLSQSATSWTSNSDERLKTDLVAIENATEKVASLRSVIGRYKTDDESKRRPFLIAQDVYSVLPEAVDIDKKTGMMGVQYTEVIPLLVASIKELKSKIETLENK